MFEIATDTPEPQGIFVKSSVIERGQRVDLRDATRAERLHRQIIENIEAHEDPDALNEYVEAESLIIDAMFMEWPEYAAAITDAHEAHLIILKAGLASVSTPKFNGVTF